MHKAFISVHYTPVVNRKRIVTMGCMFSKSGGDMEFRKKYEMEESQELGHVS